MMNEWENKVERLLFRFKSKKAMPVVAFLLVSMMLLVPLAALANSPADVVYGVDHSYRVNLSADPASGGTVSGGGDYEAGVEVNASADAQVGYEFVNWTRGGSVVSDSASYTFPMPAEDFTLTANFEVDVSAVSYQEDWDGRGTDSESCGLDGEGPRDAEAGWIHWIFNTKGDSTSAELVLGGTGSGSYSPAAPLNAETYHFYTPYFELDGLTATIFLYGGESGSGGGLVISDYCPGTGIEDQATTSSISITKVIQDADGDDLDPQPDVNIEVNVNHDDGEYDEDHTVNPSTGATVVENLPLGEYTITEVDSNEYENVSIVPSQFELTADVIVQVVVTNREVEVEPIGENTGSITINKVISDSQEESDPPVIKSFTFEILDENDNVIEAGVEVEVTNGVGSETVEDLPFGTYKVVELDNDAYDVTLDPVDGVVNITGDNTEVTINVTNTPKPRLFIEKVLLNLTGNPISSDIEFTVVLDGGTFDEEEITFSVNSPAELGYSDGLKFDIEYTITEVDHADYNFASIDPAGSFTLTEDEFEITVTVTNQQQGSGEDEGEGEVEGEVVGEDEGEVEGEVEVVGEGEGETPEQVVVAQEQPQTTPDETVTVDPAEPQTEPEQETGIEPEEPQTEPGQETETESEEPGVDPEGSDEVTVDPEEPQSVPDSSGTVIPIISLGVLLLSSGGVLLRKYKDE